MKLTLDQNEIEQAIIAYARNCITLAEGTSITVDMTAGRGPNGFSATLDITPGVAKAKPVQVIVTQDPITKEMFYKPVSELSEVSTLRKLPEDVAQPEVFTGTVVTDLRPPVTEPVIKSQEFIPVVKPAKAAAKATEAKANPFAKLPQADLEKQIQEDLEAADKVGNQEPQEPVEAPVEEPATEAPKLATSIFSKAAASGA